MSHATFIRCNGAYKKAPIGSVFRLQGVAVSKLDGLLQDMKTNIPSKINKQINN